MKLRRFIVLCLLIFAMCYVYAAPIRVATWNIRCIEKKDSISGNEWQKRAPEISKIIQFQNFEIIGMQEADSIQQSMLKQMLPEYQFVNGDTYGNPIVYRSSRFKVLNHGTFWYSGSGVPKIKGWDAKHPRFCNWVHFFDKNNQQDFFIFNTHWDHKGDTARVESAKMTLQILKATTEGKPFLFLGDLNSKPNRKALKILEKGGFQDSRKVASYIYAPRPSFNHFKEKISKDNNLDYIYSHGNIKVIRFGILDFTYRDGEILRFPSDHFPVMIDFEFTSGINL